MKFSIIASAVAVATLAFSYAPAAQAGDWQNSAGWPTPAASCIPARPVDRTALTLASGSWMFDTNQIGTSYLICPMSFPFEYFDSAGNFTSNSYSFPNVWYRDSDGTSTNVSVKVELFRRFDTGATATLLGTVLDSNLYSPPLDRMQVSPFGQSPMPGSGWIYARVTLKRTTTAQTAAFSGLVWQ